MNKIDGIKPKIQQRNHKNDNKSEKRDKKNSKQIKIKKNRNNQDVSLSDNGIIDNFLNEKDILNYIDNINNEVIYQKNKIFFTYDEESKKRPIVVRSLETNLTIQKLTIVQFIAIVKSKDLSRIGILINTYG